MATSHYPTNVCQVLWRHILVSIICFISCTSADSPVQSYPQTCPCTWPSRWRRQSDRPWLDGYTVSAKNGGFIFFNKNNPSLVKPSLKFIGGLATLELSSLNKLGHWRSLAPHSNRLLSWLCKEPVKESIFWLHFPDSIDCFMSHGAKLFGMWNGLVLAELPSARWFPPPCYTPITCAMTGLETSICRTAERTFIVDSTSGDPSIKYTV